ncbi:hypothetical protein GEMRC1_008657 [Eukaryota sp. GEM-RC1]
MLDPIHDFETIHGLGDGYSVDRSYFPPYSSGPHPNASSTKSKNSNPAPTSYYKPPVSPFVKHRKSTFDSQQPTCDMCFSPSNNAQEPITLSTNDSLNEVFSSSLLNSRKKYIDTISSSHNLNFSSYSDDPSPRALSPELSPSPVFSSDSLPPPRFPTSKSTSSPTEAPTVTKLPTVSKCKKIHSKIISVLSSDADYLKSSKLLFHNRPDSRNLRVYFGDLPPTLSDLKVAQKKRVCVSQSSHFQPVRRASRSENISDHIPPPKLSTTYVKTKRKKREISNLEDIFKCYNRTETCPVHHDQSLLIAPYTKSKLFTDYEPTAPRKTWVKESQKKGIEFELRCKKEEHMRRFMEERQRERNFENRRHAQREFIRSQAAKVFRNSLIIGEPFSLGQFDKEYQNTHMEKQIVVDSDEEREVAECIDDFERSLGI